ncbi:hypothetical protein GJAV_G00250620 [Gymnothorax javanicus]|nr:hypothetical protein GJAV_G00250620 [Gymnothorax javanicus]
MFGGYEQLEDYEDELYRDSADSSSSEAESEVEFQLYSQLHYTSCPEKTKEDEEVVTQEKGRPQPDVRKWPTKGVIVIDSDPEVITISDNSEEEEEAVCIAKGNKLQYQPPATRGQPPAHVASPLAASSDCSEDSDSDSDGLESWMMLGQKEDESDKTIQLNLTGGASSSDDDDDDQNWSISQKDQEAGIYNRGPGPRRVLNRYYAGKTVTCRSCSKMGHLSKNCPNPKKRPSCSLCGSQTHLQKACPNRHCNNCGLPGHCFDDCLDQPFWRKRCHRCYMTGHFYDDCPDTWRQYHLTTKTGPMVRPEAEEPPKNPAYCYNCSKKGHFGFECKQQRMVNKTFPTTPYIAYYDKPEDIRKRENRARRKAEELRSAGFLRLTSGEELGWGDGEEGPPRKSMKIQQNSKKEKKKKSKAVLSKAKKQKNTDECTEEERRLYWQKEEQFWRFYQEPVPLWKKRKIAWEKKQQKRKGLKQPWSEAKTSRPVKNGQGYGPAAEGDFPRGPKRKTHGGPAPPPKVVHRPGLFGQGKNRKKQRRRGRDRKPGDRQAEHTYRTDENLFNIKQRRKK